MMRNRLLSFLLLATIVAVFCQGSVSSPYPIQGCKPGWTNFGNFCYRFFNNRTNWLEAQTHCKSYSAVDGITPPGYLMTAKDIQHNRFQHNWLLYTGGAQNKVWLGLAERANNDYYWADGTRLEPNHWNRWKVDQPQLNAHIQAVHTFDNMVDNTWVTSFYKTEMTFICQYQYKA